jgi:hypothetical protein
MAQITLYLDVETMSRMRLAAQAAGLSMSAWVGHLVRERTRDTWPDEILALAGAWPDLPEAAMLRATSALDTERESL